MKKDIRFDSAGYCWDLSLAPKDEGTLKAIITRPFFGALLPEYAIGCYTYEDVDENDEAIYQWYLVSSDTNPSKYTNDQVLAWGYVDEADFNKMPKEALEKLKSLIRNNIPKCHDTEEKVKSEYEWREAVTFGHFKLAEVTK